MPQEGLCHMVQHIHAQLPVVQMQHPAISTRTSIFCDVWLHVDCIVVEDAALFATLGQDPVVVQSISSCDAGVVVTVKQTADEILGL